MQVFHNAEAAPSCQDSEMRYSSKVVDMIGIALAVVAILGMAYFLFRKTPVVEVIRPEACRESDIALDLRAGREGPRLTMSDQADRDERCARIMRGVAR